MHVAYTLKLEMSKDRQNATERKGVRRPFPRNSSQPGLSQTPFLVGMKAAVDRQGHVPVVEIAMEQAVQKAAMAVQLITIVFTSPLHEGMWRPMRLTGRQFRKVCRHLRSLRRS